ncbi:MAG: SpoIIE family protein phosphatase [Gammaproteobacteria bacterium]|nr:SpoIIE family protein phosphatase [Gammaproteobacteria bacterium]
MPYINPDDHIYSDNIPMIPGVVQRFLDLQNLQTIQDADVDSIKADYPDFFDRLLSIVNSDHFNLTTKVESIAQAIRLAGYESICNLMLCLAVYRSFSEINITGVEQQAFWEDSLRRAVSARMIGEVIGLDGGRCFTAGMLQDMGFFVLFLISQNKGMMWGEFRKRDPEARYSMERNIFNMNHDEAMSLFSNKWNLFDVVSLPMINHHRCEKSELNIFDEQLCQVLYCADWMASVYTSIDKSFAINRCRKILTETFQMESFRAEEFLAAMPDEIDITGLVFGIKIKQHIEFSQILYEANMQLSEDNLNFQELTSRLEQALSERDRLAAELNKELGLAREIQKSLLPHDMGEDFPLVGLNISARDLSGDFYDYFKLPDGKIYFNLGDVSGKGVNAALLMTKTSSLFRCLGKRIHQPGELLAQINIELCETSIHGMFVTMIAGLYDPQTGKLKIVNAGNPPALLFTVDGLAYEVEAQALPLGVLTDSSFPEVEIELEDKSLYMFSDGVTEGNISESEMLGLSGLFKVIANMKPGLSPAERIHSIVSHFQNTSLPVRDDITILLLEDQKYKHETH